MASIHDLIARVQGEINAKLTERNAAADKLNELRAASTTDEAAVAAVREEIRGFDAELDAASNKLAEYRDDARRDEAAKAMRSEVAPSASAASASDKSVRGAYDSVIRTGDTVEPRTYTERGSAIGETSFMQDMYKFHRSGGLESPGAHVERLKRHASEVAFHGEQQLRAAGTGAFAGLVVPQYLTDKAALALRAGRPLANVIQREQIPAEGMSFVIPKMTAGASVGAQAAENTAVSSTDDSWNNVTVQVATIAGAQDVSRQLLERGTPGIDQLLYLDLTRAYASAVGSQIYSGTGVNGQTTGLMSTTGILTATAFGATATYSNFNSKVGGGIGKILNQGQGIAADLLIVSPLRWGWLLSQVDSQGRPLVQANAELAFNTLAAGGLNPDELAAADVQVVGVHNSGLPILIDLNVPTNVGTNAEDTAWLVDKDQLILWEDGDGMPRQLSFEQTTGGSLTTKLVSYNYIAFTAGRYAQAVARIGGADTVAGQGLILPASSF